MNSTLSLLLVFLTRFFMPRHNAQMRLLKAQIHILRARIPAQRIILSPAEKAELLRIGAEFGHDIDGLMEVARPATYKRWLAQMRSGRPFRAVGRPRLTHVNGGAKVGQGGGVKSGQLGGGAPWRARWPHSWREPWRTGPLGPIVGRDFMVISAVYGLCCWRGDSFRRSSRGC